MRQNEAHCDKNGLVLMVSMMKLWSYTWINELFPREQFSDAIKTRTPKEMTRNLDKSELCEGLQIAFGVCIHKSE